MANLPDDLVARLRDIAGKYDEYDWHGAIELEAATEIERLRAELEQADAINGTSVNRICALEAQIATLKGRIKALRKSINNAYDTLAIASSEDSSHD